MKKRITFILLITLLICSACTYNISEKNQQNELDLFQNQNADSGNKSDEFIDDTITADVKYGVVFNRPSWAIGTQMEGELFQNLNLDGIGDADDEVYISIYEFGDYDDKVTVISIHLGTGETIAKSFPIYGYYLFLTGRVFSEDKDAIILEIQDPTSNYGAATIFALDVNQVGIDPIPTVTIKLDTMKSVMLSDGKVIEDSVLSSYVTGGTKIVDTLDKQQQGIRINFIGKDGLYQEKQKIFYWTENGWTVISEEKLD